MTAAPRPAAIRALNAADAGAWLGLRVRSVAESPRAFHAAPDEEARISLAEAAARLSASPKKDVVLGAFLDRALVGAAGVHREPRSKRAHLALVWGVWVAPAARGRGIGRLLLDAAVAHARTAMGVERLLLGVATDNEPARRLYSSLGFRTWGIERGALIVDGASVDEEHMALDLVASPAPCDSAPPGAAP